MPSLNLFVRLLKGIPQHRLKFLRGILFSFLKKIFDIAPEILIGVAIEVVVNREKSFLPISYCFSKTYSLIIYQRLDSSENL